MSDSKLAEALRNVLALIDDLVELDGADIREAREALAAHEKQQAAQKQAEQQAGEAVAWVDERAIAWLDGRNRTATITTKLQAGKSLERPMPIYTRPLQPLSEYQIVRIYEQPELAGTRHASGTDKAIAIARAIEAAHGITKDTK